MSRTMQGEIDRNHPVVQEWTCGGRDIVATQWDGHRECLWVITHHGDDWRLLRFFVLGTHVSASVDVEDTANSFIARMMDSLIN